jgi:hypothetical protein
MPKDKAVILDNWFPKPDVVSIRKGHEQFCTGLGSSVVESLMGYNAGNPSDSKLFAGANSSIYDVGTGTASQSVTSLNSNRWQYVNFTTSGGHFLWCCNGADDPRTYKTGTGWATPSLTVTTFGGSDIINVNVHKKRLWFVFKNSTVAGYLDVEAVAGTVTNFDLGNQFSKGGYLVAMATWTRDGGSGPDDLAVFISSEGQVVVYQGDDPSSSDTWSLIGVFNLGPPIGYRCFEKVAGDVALINIDGVLPLSKALQQDRGAAAAIAITKNINNAMNRAAGMYKANFGWQLTPYPKSTMAILNIPITEGSEQQQFVMNTLTGAWCRFTGMNANCWAVWKDDLYFGGNAGIVYKADAGGSDDGEVITASGQTAYNYYGKPGQHKQWKMVQPIITAGAQLSPALGISTDFKDNATLGTSTVIEAPSAAYDTALYDTDVYAIESSTSADWQSVAGEGYCAAIHFRAQTQSDGEAILALNGFNVIYETGLVL